MRTGEYEVAKRRAPSSVTKSYEKRPQSREVRRYSARKPSSKLKTTIEDSI